LGGRRVRGYVLELGERESDRLRPIAGLVTEAPMFDHNLLGAMQWAAAHYVAPLSVTLDRARPPNLPRRGPGAPSSFQGSIPEHRINEWARRAAGSRRPGTIAFITRWWDQGWLEALAVPALNSGRSVLVVAATADEVGQLAHDGARFAADHLLVVSPDSDDAETTRVWAAARSPGWLLIASPRVAFWPIAGLAAVAVVEEGRRAMKDRQAPTVAVRDLMKTRSAIERFGLAFVGPTPSVETLAAGAEVIRARNRAWPVVEVVDRNAGPPSSGVLTSAAISAIRAVSGRGGSVFVFAHRRGYAPASRCERCHTLRRCANCGARPEFAPICARCGEVLGACSACGHDRFVPLGAGVGRVQDELRHLLPAGVLGESPSPGASRVKVGSEADLAGLSPQDLTVAVDPDGLILGTHYRAAEEALRVLARLAGKVAGRGSRCLIQTQIPDHPVVIALKKGDPLLFLEPELEERAKHGFPPAGELLVVELRGTLPDGAGESVKEAAAGATVMGPVERRNGGHRWLLQAPDLTKARHGLRSVVQRWRDAGVTVRVDADPLEL
jgi:primosomal protein N' (replication factor Y)